jgi:hypothetical protein
LEHRFSDWRKTRKPGQRIPKPLWRAAAKQVAECGLNRTAAALNLDYYSLKKHVEEQSAGSAFVELPSVSVNGTSECIIELDDGRGARMRMHLKGSAVPDVLSLSRSFWNND